MSLKAAALRASKPACASDVSVKVVVEKTKHRLAPWLEVLTCDARIAVRREVCYRQGVCAQLATVGCRIWIRAVTL